MTPDLAAKLTLTGYLVVAVVVIVWRARRWPTGWQLWFLYGIAALYSRLCQHWRSNNRCPFDRPGPAIAIVNHRSPVDPMLFWVGLRSKGPCGFLTAKEYISQWGLRFITKHQESIPVARDGQDMSAIRAALRRLQEGKLLGVFPEGRINTGDGLLPGNSGVGWLAIRSKAPVFPVFIHNAPASDSMVGAFFVFNRVFVEYGDPIDLSRFLNRKLTEELTVEVTEYLMEQLAALGAKRNSEPEQHTPIVALRQPA